MEYEILRKVQLCQLDMALEVKRICEKHNIMYFIVYGSLLGAVRHKGFIPWDDDFDYGMPYKDYKKFLTIAKNELGDRFFLQNYYTDKNYGCCFSKVLLKNTAFIEKSVEHCNIEKGIYIDILPFSKIPKNKMRSILNTYKFYKTLLAAKSNYELITSIPKKVLYDIIFKNLSKVFKKDYIINKLELLMKKYEYNIKSDTYCNLASMYKTKDYIPACDMTIQEQLEFEGNIFNVFRNYDAFLKRCYGDYMQFPPESKRNIGHNIVKIDFGNYAYNYTGFK